MAEYIDRVEAMNIIAGGKNDKAYFGTTNKDWEVIDFLKDVPTADVIERSKIDKAIEEIEKIDLIVHDGINHYYKDGEEVIAEVLEILKRNIGE